MLIDVESGEPIDHIPHSDLWQIVLDRLSTAQMQSIFRELERRTSNKEVNVAGWLPGSDWSGTPFQAIFEIAARSDYDTSARMFGLFVWVYFMERLDRWGFGRYDTATQHVESMTYFRLPE